MLLIATIKHGVYDKQRTFAPSVTSKRPMSSDGRKIERDAVRFKTAG